VNNLKTARILVVDDHPYSRLATIDILKLDGYEILESDGNSDVVQEAIAENIDLLMLDIMVPQKKGLEICHEFRQHPQTAMIPAILMTVMDDAAVRIKAKEVGADACLLKPLDRTDLLPRVDLLLQKKRLTEWVDQIEQVLFRVAQVLDERHAEGASSFSLSQFAQIFGEYLKLEPEALQDLVFAARLHDIGTAAIPDAILLKQGKLTPTERELIKQHVLVGEKIFQPLAYRREIGKIMRHHHERWDGSGYPDGLQGEQIPWLAQVFQIIDIYNALTSDRPYKAAVSPDEALSILQQEAEQGWRNPQLVKKFADFIQEQDLIHEYRQNAPLCARIETSN